MQNIIENHLQTISNNFIKLQDKSDIIEKIAQLWIHTLENKNKIIFCGNGGSAADSQHLAAELMGKYKIDRAALAAISLTTDTSAITATGNDYGFDQVFARPLKGIGQKGDTLVGISTSGNSKNIIEAFKTAKIMNITTVAFTGENGGDLNKYSDIILNVPSQITNNIQELHIASGHIICEIVENYFFNK